LVNATIRISIILDHSMQFAPASIRLVNRAPVIDAKSKAVTSSPFHPSDSVTQPDSSRLEHVMCKILHSFSEFSVCFLEMIVLRHRAALPNTVASATESWKI
jgi:VanZ family protein